MKHYHQLTQEERYHITFLMRRGYSIRYVAKELGCSPSTISRKRRRNATHHDGGYRAEKAHSYAVARRRRCRRKSHFSEEHWLQVKGLLRKKWSPDQISGYLKKEGILRISHESIYRYILKDKRKGGMLYKYTRIMPKIRRKRYNSYDSRGIMRGKRHISERPEAVESREEQGHWEGDTVIGKDKKHCLLTLVERKTGYTLIRKLSARTKAEVTEEASKVLEAYLPYFKTITFDNGTEFHDFALLEERFSIKCYFATPYHSWERGTNENTNGLIRQYIPKGECMKPIGQVWCDEVADALNTRPRKRLGYKTPKELFYGLS